MNVWNHVNGCDCATRMAGGSATAQFPTDFAPEPVDADGNLANPSLDASRPEGWALDADGRTLVYTDADGYIVRAMVPGARDYDEIRAGLDDPSQGHIGDGEPFTEAPEMNLTPSKGGRTDLIDSVTERLPREPGSPFERTSLHLNGQPHIKQRVMIAKEAYLEEQTDADRARIDAILEAGEPATVLMVADNGTVSAREGKFFKSGPGWSCPEGTPLFMEKGKRAKAATYSRDKIVDAAPGYGKAADLGRKFGETMAATSPALSKISGNSAAERFQNLPECYDGPPPDKIAAVYVIDNPDFSGGRVNGCMFMATDIQRGAEPGDQDVVNGYFWAPGNSGLYSENSSMYADDLARRGGQVRDYQPGSLTFRECWESMPENRSGAFRRVVNARRREAKPAAAPQPVSAAAAPASSPAPAPAQQVPRTPAGWGQADRDELPF